MLFIAYCTLISEIQKVRVTADTLPWHTQRFVWSLGWSQRSDFYLGYELKVQQILDQEVKSQTGNFRGVQSINDL